jgi:hypothetical protein
MLTQHDITIALWRLLAGLSNPLQLSGSLFGASNPLRIGQHTTDALITASPRESDLTHNWEGAS